MSGDLDDIDLNADGASAVPAKDASSALSAEPVVSSGAETLADSVNGEGEGGKAVVEGVPAVQEANESKDCEGIESSNGGVDDSEAGGKMGGEGVPEVEGMKNCEGKVESSNGGVDDSEAPVKANIEVADLGVLGGEEERSGKAELNGSGQAVEGATTDGGAIQVQKDDSSPPVSGIEDAETQVAAGSSPSRVSKDEETIKASKHLGDEKMEIDEPKTESEPQKVIVRENGEKEEQATTDGGAIQVQTNDSSRPASGNEDSEMPEKLLANGSSQNRVSKDEETRKATEHLQVQKMEIDEPRTESEPQKVNLQENGKIKPDNSDRVVSPAGSSTKGGRSRSKFADSDLVWGKVRSHPWWPGQIFDKSTASDKARKHFKKDGHLIAYFWDQTFAWNETSKIKPFRAYFSQMAKQSDLEEFHDAVDCALDEVARRVEFGLACPCLAEYNEIKTQVIVNPGIKDEFCRRDGGDECSSAASFSLEKLVEYIKGIGQSPLGGVDRLEFLTARSQVLAFSRWKGYSQLPELQILGTAWDDKVDVKSSEVELTQAGDENDKKTSSKRKRNSVDKEQTPAKREKTLAALIAERRSNDKSKSSNGKSKPESKAIGKSGDLKKRKAADSGFDDFTEEKSQTLSSPEASGKNTSHPKKGSFGIGHSILKVANEMNGSSPILKSQDKSSPQRTKEKKKNGSKKKSAESRGKKSSTKGDSPPTKIPEEEGSDQALEGNSLLDSKNGEGEVIAAASELPPTDQQVHTSIPQQQNDDEEDAELPRTDEQGDTSNPEQQNGDEEDIDDADAVVKPPTSEQVEEKSRDDNPSPTALILNFTDFESAPTVEQLNKIFGHFGTLKESETQVLQKSSRARVVFCKRDDAETAFSSAGKYSTFGPSLVSYRLKYLPSPKKSSPSSGRKSSSSGKK